MESHERPLIDFLFSGAAKKSVVESEEPTVNLHKSKPWGSQRVNMRLSQRKQIEIAAIIGTFCIGLFLFDYFHTRSSANLAITLARLGPETPLETYKAEFGEPTYHLTNIEEMKERGPAKMTRSFGEAAGNRSCR